MKVLVDISDFVVERIKETETYEEFVRISYFKLLGDKYEKVCLDFKISDKQEEITNREDFKQFLTILNHITGIKFNA